MSSTGAGRCPSMELGSTVFKPPRGWALPICVAVARAEAATQLLNFGRSPISTTARRGPPYALMLTIRSVFFTVISAFALNRSSSFLRSGQQRVHVLEHDVRPDLDRLRLTPVGELLRE